MRTKHIKILFVSLLGLVTGATLVVANTFKGGMFSNAETEECSYHEGFHYAAKAATDDECGWKEFWACCKCHHQYIGTAPAGSWTDQSADDMIGGIDSDHIAYIAPLTQGGNGDYWKEDPFDED